MPATITITYRRDYGTHHQPFTKGGRFTQWAAASAQMGHGDDGHRVVHTRVGDEYTEPPVRLVRR